MKANQNQHWKDLYGVSDIWFYILEFIPALNLLSRFSVVNQFHHQVIHSPHTYAQILMRDFIEYKVIPKFYIKKILTTYDYKRTISKIVNSKVQVMKFSKKNVSSAEKPLSKQELNGIYKSFQSMYIVLHTVMERIMTETLSDREHRLFFIAQQLETIQLPKCMVDDDEEEEEDNDYFDDYDFYAYTDMQLNTPKHSITQVDKHEFAERLFFQGSEVTRVCFCKCGLTYCVSEKPHSHFQIPNLKKDGKEKLLYHLDETTHFTFLKKSVVFAEASIDSLDAFVIPFEYKK